MYTGFVNTSSKMNILNSNSWENLPSEKFYVSKFYTKYFSAEKYYQKSSLYAVFLFVYMCD